MDDSDYHNMHRIFTDCNKGINMKKVNVLLSAYNGEKYIEEQIESILNQTHTNLELYVRDDGSKDNTLAVLKKYEDNPLVHVIKGENVGFIKSFLELVRLCSDADFYAYSDQDDVWFPGKLEMAMEFFEREQKNHEIPILYFSNYDFYNGNMEFVEHAKTPSITPSFHNALVDCLSLGFNSVFNHCARSMICEQMPEHSCGHDWWTYMVCVAMGKVIYDDRPTVCYRRHGSNVSAGGMSFLKFQIWRLKKFFLNDYFSNIRRQMREFYDFYRDRLLPEDRKLLELFCQEKYRISTALKKTFYSKRYRGKMTDELMVRFIMLIGKL